jgi:hypothetical protein
MEISEKSPAVQPKTVPYTHGTILGIRRLGKSFGAVPAVAPVVGWFSLKWVPILRRSRESLSGGDFQSLSIRLWSIPCPRGCSPALAAPQIAKIGSTHRFLAL